MSRPQHCRATIRRICAHRHVSVVLRSMAVASSGGGGAPLPHVWVKVKGGSAHKYQKRGLEDVSDLLDKVKEVCNVLLRDVDVSQLALYQSEQVKNEGGMAASAIQCSTTSIVSRMLLRVLEVGLALLLRYCDHIKGDCCDF